MQTDREEGFYADKPESTCPSFSVELLLVRHKIQPSFIILIW